MRLLAMPHRKPGLIPGLLASFVLLPHGLHSGGATCQRDRPSSGNWLSFFI